jgi:CBS domain containing-hemolysin-like protein
VIINSTGFIFLIVSLAFDGILSATSNAFVNSHPKRLLEEKRQGRFGAALAVRVAEDSTNLILSMRVMRGFLRIITIGFAALSFSDFFLTEGTLDFLALAGILLTFGILIGLFELLAESFVLRSPNNWAVLTSYLAQFIILLTKPITVFAQKLGGVVTGLELGEDQPLVTEEEIMTLVDAGEEGGAIEEEEKAMIYSIFQLGDTLAREVMIPRIDIQSLDGDTTLAESTDLLLKSGFSRAPVYRNSVDHIIGLAYIKDLLDGWRKGRQFEPISNFMREAYFIPEGMKLDDLLAEMQSKRVHMAVVVDEYGGTAGVVTIEDIVEEIVGEIRDEYDFAEEASYQQLKDGEFLFSGGIDLDDVNLLAGSELPKDTSETLGGFIYGHLGRVPKRGEVVEAGGLRLIVDQVAGRRIRKVRASTHQASISENNSDEA